ncbi:MAG: hypothetical protein NT070_09030 [Cyanobacteria bacterium]|nr:hypothetical protein [Cyanobacteriota bacterium]
MSSADEQLRFFDGDRGEGHLEFVEKKRSWFVVLQVLKMLFKPI